MMKHDSTTTTNNHPTSATVCGECGREERKLLHNIRHRSNFRRLCTTCVLRLNPLTFCPACLGVYDRSPPDDAVVCYKCYSSSHPNCISNAATAPATSIQPSRGPSPCSACLNPSSLVLNLNRVENGSRSGGRSIDKSAARLLLAAGKIAAGLMSKAEAAAALEAEKRSKEASYTKKRAREALDHVVYLMGKEKRIAVDSSSNNNNNNNKKVSNMNNNGGVVAMPVVSNVNNKVDSSNEVLEALNAVELKEKVKSVVVSESQGNNGVMVMEVDVVHGKDSGVNSVVENGSVGKTDNLGKVAQGEKIGNGLVSSVGQEQGVEKINSMEENGVSSLKH